MRGYHYVLTSAFHQKDIKTFKLYLLELEELRYSKYSKLNLNSQIVSFQYVHNGRMNLHFLEGTFEEGMKNIPNTLSRIHRYSSKLGAHKVMVIYYKVSWMLIGNSESQKAIKYLKMIINMTDKSLRLDIQCYSRIMLLLALYEVQDYRAFDTNIEQIKRFFKKKEIKNQTQLLIIEMLQKLMLAGEYDRKSILTKYYSNFDVLKQDKYERRAFIYLDILPWIYSKIKKVKLSKAIQSLHLLI
jgi:hypothetical protein